MSPKKLDRHLIVIDRIVAKEGSEPYGFGVIRETGEQVYIPPAVVLKHEIVQSDVGDNFFGFVREAEGFEAYRLSAFLEWEDEAPMAELIPVDAFMEENGQKVFSILQEINTEVEAFQASIQKKINRVSAIMADYKTA